MKGQRAKGFHDENSPLLFKVSVAWLPEQFDAINRRVVQNNSTFAKEARRLMDIALRVDHMPKDINATDTVQNFSAANI